jgi:hypothetical protein
MDMARSMLAEFKSPYNFWAEAISTACYSSNRLYLCKGLNKTPYEILIGNKPNINYFRFLVVSVSFLEKEFVWVNLILKHLKVYLLVMLPNPTLI